MVEYDWEPAKSEARAHQEKFEIEWDEHKQQFVILHENLTFAIINTEGYNLPEGFPARATTHLFETLIGRRGSLWMRLSMVNMPAIRCTLSIMVIAWRGT